MSTISETLIPSLVGLTSSLAVWLTLEKMFSSQSRARIMTTRYTLATLKKGSLTITDYFQKAKACTDLLASIGEPISDSAITSYILAGLPHDYDSIIATVNTRVEAFPLDELYGHLLTHELRIDQQICFKAGHTAQACWHRFDQNFQVSSNQSPQAFVASTSSTVDLAWYPDTGANNHITADYGNLNLHAEDYTGQDQVRIGNGQGNLTHSFSLLASVIVYPVLTPITKMALWKENTATL
uniref:Uncharacterized protein n=1 Tax=Fagus sylvatica TaxID=28930 RepID=A0A2N9ILG5_FAGSY